MAKKEIKKFEFDTTKTYSPEQAAEMVKKASTAKFVASVDIDILMNISDSKKKENISGSIVLPNKFGEPVRVAVIAEGEDQAKAKKAGADIVGHAELIKEISEGKANFDILIATPSVMRDLARLGKVLGPRNLMPSPKNETVTQDIEKAVETYKAGKLNFKMSDQKTIKTKIGTVAMPEKEIVENLVAIVKAVAEEAKKLGAQPFKKITLSPTMGKGVKVDYSGIL